jgi:hypothetical protein
MGNRPESRHPLWRLGIFGETRSGRGFALENAIAA